MPDPGERNNVYRLVDGRIVERWAKLSLGVLDQLGIPAPRMVRVADPSCRELR